MRQYWICEFILVAAFECVHWKNHKKNLFRFAWDSLIVLQTKREERSKQKCPKIIWRAHRKWFSVVVPYVNRSVHSSYWSFLLMFAFLFVYAQRWRSLLLFSNGTHLHLVSVWFVWHSILSSLVIESECERTEDQCVCLSNLIIWFMWFRISVFNYLFYNKFTAAKRIRGTETVHRVNRIEKRRQKCRTVNPMISEFVCPFLFVSSIILSFFRCGSRLMVGAHTSK